MDQKYESLLSDLFHESSDLPYLVIVAVVVVVEIASDNDILTIATNADITKTVVVVNDFVNETSADANID